MIYNNPLYKKAFDQNGFPELSYPNIDICINLPDEELGKTKKKFGEKPSLSSNLDENTLEPKINLQSACKWVE